MWQTRHSRAQGSLRRLLRRRRAGAEAAVEAVVAWRRLLLRLLLRRYGRHCNVALCVAVQNTASIQRLATALERRPPSRLSNTVSARRGDSLRASSREEGVHGPRSGPSLGVTERLLTPSHSVTHSVTPCHHRKVASPYRYRYSYNVRPTRHLFTVAVAR